MIPTRYVGRWLVSRVVYELEVERALAETRSRRDGRAGRMGHGIGEWWSDGLRVIGWVGELLLLLVVL